jgi:hypothetical protein
VTHVISGKRVAISPTVEILERVRVTTEERPVRMSRALLGGISEPMFEPKKLERLQKKVTPVDTRGRGIGIRCGADSGSIRFL